jgi:hypothetical protein
MITKPRCRLSHSLDEAEVVIEYVTTANHEQSGLPWPPPDDTQKWDDGTWEMADWSSTTTTRWRRIRLKSPTPEQSRA